METLTSTVTANNAKKYTAEGFSRLANAIVIKAASDYRIALRCDIKHRKCPKGVDRIELERFFTSGWYESLTDVDGRALMRMLQEEACNSHKKRIRRV